MGLAVRPALSQSGRRLLQYLTECVRVDTRTLAVFRIVVGLLVLADLSLRSRNFSYFYTDDGVVPRSLVLELSSGTPLSVYHLTTDPTLIAGLFVLQGLIAVQLIVGYRTRLATILSFLFVVSLDHHNPFVLSYADTLFRLLLFWAVFLPLGERWSIDAVHRDREPRGSIATVASALILGQMIFMYFSNGLIKSQSDVWGSGDAAPLVLGIHEMTFLLGDFVAQFPTLLSIGGLTWYYMLLFSPLLVLLTGRWRLPLIGLFAIGHLSFAVTVRIGAFAYVALAGLLLFVQTQHWEDGTRLLGYASVDLGRLAAVAARLESIAARVPEYRLGGDRLARIHGFDSDRLRWLRERTYTLTIGIVVATILFVTAITLVNLAIVVAADSGDDRPLEERVEGVLGESLETTGVKQVDTVATSLGINQPLGWGVFAGPDPRTTDRYYVFPAQTASGERVDAFNERPLSYDRPDRELQSQHSTYRERFYMNSVRRGGATNDVPVLLAEHICTRWADEHGETLTHLNMYVVNENITHETIHAPDDRERSYSLIYRHGCGDNEPRPIEPPA